MAKDSKFNTNKEANNLLVNLKGSIENKIRTAYNLGYKDGYNDGKNNVISDMIGMMSDRWDADRKTEPTPHDDYIETENDHLEARCLNCNNAKACKEKHWEGCVYEPKYEKTCETCKHWKYIAREWQCETTKCQGYTPKDEPSGYCNECKWYGDKQVCGRCRSRNLFAPKDEPSGYNLSPVEDEPQTDGILFKGNLKEGDYKLIKTSNGWVLEGNDIAYCGEPQTEADWKDEMWADAVKAMPQTERSE